MAISKAKFIALEGFDVSITDPSISAIDICLRSTHEHIIDPNSGKPLSNLEVLYAPLGDIYVQLTNTPQVRGASEFNEDDMLSFLHRWGVPLAATIYSSYNVSKRVMWDTYW